MQDMAEPAEEQRTDSSTQTNVEGSLPASNTGPKENPVFKTFYDMVFEKILEADNVVARDVTLDRAVLQPTKHNDLNSARMSLKTHLDLIQKAIEKFDRQKAFASSTETVSTTTTRCCAFDTTPGLNFNPVSKINYNFTLKFGSVGVTFDLTLSSTPTLLSRDIRGVCGTNGGENQEMQVTSYLLYAGKLVLTSDGTIIFGNLCLAPSSSPSAMAAGLGVASSGSSGGGITIDISIPGEAVKQRITKTLQLPEDTQKSAP